MLRYLYLIIFCLLVMPVTVEARTLKLEDYLNWEWAADPMVSPDGKRVIYTRMMVNKFKDRKESELWMMEPDGSRPRFLTKGREAKWSPLGDRIAYIVEDEGGRPQLFTRYMDTEGIVSQITRDGQSPSIFSWSPDGKQIAFLAGVPMKPGFDIRLPGRPEGVTWTADPLVFERLHYRFDRFGPKNSFFHIFTVDAAGGTPRQITSGNWDVAFERLLWTPNGRHIIFSGVVDESNEELGALMEGHINSVDVKSGKISFFTTKDGFWFKPRLSPDGKYLAYLGNPLSDDMYARWATPMLWVREMASGKARRLYGPLPSAISFYEWAMDSKGLYLSVERKGSTDLIHIPLHGQLRDVTDGTQSFKLFSLHGKDTAYGVMTAAHITPNIAKVNLSKGAIDQLGDLNGDILEDVELGEVEEIWYPSSDNSRIQGWIIKPPAFDPAKKYPLMLFIHGGPHDMYSNSFDFMKQQFAADGYVVLFVNPRGSTGYGVDFVNVSHNVYPGRPSYDDLMAGVDTVLAKGYVDEKRLFIGGCSGGGILTTWMVTQTDRFAAAAALCPVTNWISMAGTSDIARWGMSRFDPPFWEDSTLWLDRSPLMHVKNVKTPTLLMTGDKDLRTPFSQAAEFYAALKMLDVPTVLIPIRDESHGTTSIPSNMMRTILYLEKWFERYGAQGAPEIK